VASSARGILYGVVTDFSGAVLPGVTVKIQHSAGVSNTMLTNDLGAFSFRNLEPGHYRVQIAFTGFYSKTLNVLVLAGRSTRVIATLQVGDVAQTMNIELAAPSAVARFTQAPETLATPRLREYFPETLLWQPALETSASGTADVRFKLADNITTWKLRVIASTKDGRVAVTEKEITAFQPFFIEHQPPKLLTAGDQIALPVVVRNYLDRNQTVDLSMKPEAWFSALDSPTRKTEIAANASRNEVFTFEARTPVKNGLQQITAQGAEAADALVKTSTVLPFGREITQVSGGILRGASVHNVTIPPQVLPGTVRGEIKIYPNLMSHVVDGIEAIMRRPYGCAEQVISSAYPSLLFLQYGKESGDKTDALTDAAMVNLKAALRLLRGYRTDSGGFSYWSHGDADAAVTAYALQFLADARKFTAVDDELLDRAREWLAKEQRTDGSWRGDPGSTAYIARVLSTPGIRRGGSDPIPSALAYLQKNVLQPQSPYVTASIALIAINIGDRALAERELARLIAEARSERDVVFWDLQTNTPFYSWGLPGRLETTAVVVRALAAGGADPALIDKGLLFLMRNKDEFGIWHSTQATVRVLETLASLVGGPRGKGRKGAGSAEVRVNGALVTKVAYGAGSQPNRPVTLDISKFLAAGANRVEVLADESASYATVQLVESHYVPWDSADKNLGSDALRYSVRFDKRDSAIGETIRVHVDAERVGFRGYGMMVAEVGLPPGADVDRTSLALAAERSGRELARYDILPDRVILYLWPRAGGTSVEFEFRPRYGVNAHAPSSRLYDYYNPDARVILLPARFMVGGVR
jgi:uncharacterized protein YfaS (alpha-2-macroglobulin family)